MSTSSERANSFLAHLEACHAVETAAEKLAPKFHPSPARVRGATRLDDTALEQRWQLIANREALTPLILDPFSQTHRDAYANNIEYFIGTVKTPVGLIGPLRVNGLFAQGDYYIPLATTEAALAASYHRGALTLTAAGGCTALLVAESVSRCPGFAFDTLLAAGQFVQWCAQQVATLQDVAASTTRHGRLQDVRFTLEGNHVYLHCDYQTGDAAGQNMATIATEAVCQYIQAHSPVVPNDYFVEANLSGDKKASALSFSSVRGKKVTAEVHLPADVVGKYLHATPQQMAAYWQMSVIGGVLSGSIGVQGHVANGLAALFLATGQDIACVSEAAVGVTRMEVTEDGDLYAAITLPNLIVGTVGGGTGLPTQAACLNLMGLAGPGHAKAFAEVCAGVTLAGELSIIAALATGQFTRAHQRLARGKSSVSTVSAS